MEREEELSRLEEQRRRLYESLDRMGDNPGPDARDLYRQISDLDTRISALREEIESSSVIKEVEGVRKTIIEERLADYKRKVGLSETEIESLRRDLENAEAMLVRAQGRWEEEQDNEDRRAQYEAAAARVNDLRTQLENSGPSVEKNTEEYYRMADVIPELEDLLAKSNPDLEYIPIEEIQRRLEEYRKRREELLKENNGDGRPVSEERAEIEKRLEELRAELRRNGEMRNDPNYDYALFRSEHSRLTGLINDLEKQISNLERTPDEIISDLEKQIADKKKEISDIESRIEASREVVTEGWMADGMLSPEEQFKKDTGLDFNPDEYDIVWSGAEDLGYNGDDGVGTPYKIVKKVSKTISDLENKLKENETVMSEGWMADGMPTPEEQFKKDTGLDFNPEEYEIVWSGAEDLGYNGDDGVGTPYKIIKKDVKTREELAKRKKDLEDLDKKKKELEDLEKKLEEAKKAKEENDKKTNGKDNSEELRIIDNRIKELEELEKLKEKFTERGNGGKDDPYTIEIPENPNYEIEIDEEAMKEEYARLKNDMYAKYYGDKDFEKEYKERVARHKSHEVEKEDGDITYRTIEDYQEREEDEKFLLLVGYKEALERMSRYEAGDTSVYAGSEEQVKAQLAKDKEFVETRNHTFDQHKNTQKDLATMGKYGEKMPYIPKQDTFLKNAGRVILNAGIFARNIVAPVYRGIGRFVAQPIHRAIFRGKEASPYKNNIFHRMVARRDYFADQARKRDTAKTAELRQNAEPGEEVKEVRHPIRNYFSSRFNAIFRAKEGNEAVLRAGTHDIKEGMAVNYSVPAIIKRSEKTVETLTKQVEKLKEELEKHPDATNAEEVKKAIQEKENAIADAATTLSLYKGADVSKIRQTDAVSDKQHAVASKEVNTLRTTVIKGFAKGIAAKYIGPKIKDWLVEHTKITKKEWVPETVEKEWVEGTTEEKMVPIYEDVYDTGKTAEEIIGANDGKDVTMFYSVHGGEVAPQTYTISSDDKITAIFQGIDNGGTGVSDTAGLTAPVLVDRTIDAGSMGANGVLNQGTTIQELIDAVGTGTIDPKTFADVYVSVSDRGWVKLSELCDGMKISEKVGEELQTIVTDGHWIDKVVPGYFKDVVVDNDRVIGVLNGLGIATKGAMIADGVQDVAENLRTTHTDTPENKPQPRQYTYDDGSDEVIPTSRREYKDREYYDDDDAR